MHNNYYFLRKLSEALQNILTGTVVSECFSQHKDELIIRFETHSKPFFIKASMAPSFPCLSFPNDFNRARKNSVDLFQTLIGCRVEGIRQFENERSFAVLLSDAKTLLFKMHGSRANLILFEQDVVSNLFRNNYSGDNNITLASLDRKIDWRYEAFLLHHDAPEKLYFTFGKIIWLYLKQSAFHLKSIDDKWQDIQQIRAKLEEPQFLVCTFQHKVIFSLFPFGDVLKTSDNPLAAMNDFFYAYTHDYAFIKEKSALISALKSKLQSHQNYYTKNFNRIAEIEKDTNYKTWADLIMANMHLIKPGTEKITLADFYNNDQPAEIKLKKDISPQKNAEIFYKKAKNQHIEIERLESALQGKDKEIERLQNELVEIEKIDDLKILRKKAGDSGIDSKKEKQPEVLPYHEFTHDTFKILVGKNAKCNDELTFKYSYKEDLWLHAKDVAGSHVIIKHQSGKPFPKNVIERAAQLAAYNSKRKTESLCPVMVTPRKFVRKRKGDPAGAVVVERESVIMVEPML